MEAAMVAVQSCGCYGHSLMLSSNNPRLLAAYHTPSPLLKRHFPTKPRTLQPSLRVHSSQSPPATQEQTVQSSLKVAKSLESIKVLDLEGKSISVADLWKDRRAVVGFTRHFGCVLCMKRADLLASRKDEFDAANVSLIIVGPGKVDQARAFAKSTNFPGEIYADPDFATHEAFKFASGVGSTVSLMTGLRVISAYLEGYRQDWELSFDEDTVSKGGWQQGGVLVAGPGKENLVYLFKDAKAGDEPNMDEIVAACLKVQ
eukprot:c18909_g1_i1 orf=146-922(+)